MADYLSKVYTDAGDWSTLEKALFETGYIDIGNDTVLFEILEFDILGREELIEGIDIHPSRIVITDDESAVLFDNYAELNKGEPVEGLSGQSNPIYDYKSGNTVGVIYVDVNQDFFAEDVSSFMFDTVWTTVIGGFLTAIVAIGLGSWLTGRITAPVTALTHATQALGEQKEAQLLPVTSNDELGQMSQAFNQMATALQTQRMLRKRLIDDVSHELNTPLSVIQLEAKGLVDQLQSPEDAAAQIMGEVTRLRNLVHDLNWLAETDSGEMRLTLEPGDLGELLTQEIGRWQTQAQTQQVLLKLDPLPTIPELRFDKVRLSQLVGNLLRNALQHTEAGDEIRVSATLSASAERSTPVVAVSVADTGAGIDPVDLPHLFERFYRADTSRSRVSGGSGLGLAIARTIIEGHAGSITISSGGIGSGTLVTFELPLINQARSDENKKDSPS